MRPIHEGEIRFVGEQIQFHGAAQHRLEDLAQQLSQQEGHTISPKQAAKRLIAGMQQAIDIHADMVRALDKMRRILKKLKKVNGQ